MNNMINDENNPELYRLSKNLALNCKKQKEFDLGVVKKVIVVPEQERQMDGAPTGDLFDVDVKDDESLKEYADEQVASSNMMTAFKLGACASWADQFEGVEIFRRICLHHPQLMNTNNISHIIEQVIEGISSLRSSCCRNGLLCYVNLFRSCNYSILIKPQAHLLTLAVANRMASGPRFISKLAEKCLENALVWESKPQSLHHKESMVPPLPIDILELLGNSCLVYHKNADVVTIILRNVVTTLKSMLTILEGSSPIVIDTTVEASMDRTDTSVDDSSVSPNVDIIQHILYTLCNIEFGKNVVVSTNSTMRDASAEKPNKVALSSINKRSKSKEHIKEAILLMYNSICPKLKKKSSKVFENTFSTPISEKLLNLISFLPEDCDSEFREELVKWVHSNGSSKSSSICTVGGSMTKRFGSNIPNKKLLQSKFKRNIEQDKHSVNQVIPQFKSGDMNECLRSPVHKKRPPTDNSLESRVGVEEGDLPMENQNCIGNGGLSGKSGDISNTVFQFLTKKDCGADMSVSSECVNDNGIGAIRDMNTIDTSIVVSTENTNKSEELDVSKTGKANKKRRVSNMMTLSVSTTGSTIAPTTTVPSTANAIKKDNIVLTNGIITTKSALGLKSTVTGSTSGNAMITRTRSNSRESSSKSLIVNKDNKTKSSSHSSSSAVVIWCDQA